MKHWIARGVLTAALLLPFASVQAFYDEYATTYSYAAAGLHLWNDGNDGGSGAKVRLGHQLNTFVGAEFQLGVGGKNNQEVSLDWLFGGYARFTLPLGQLTPFAKLGLTAVSLGGADDSQTDLGLGFGLGFELAWSPVFFVDIEYMSYLAVEAEDVNTDLDALTLGIGYRF